VLATVRQAGTRPVSASDRHTSSKC